MTSHRDEAMPLQQHLVELRRRLVVSAVALAVGFAVCYWRAEDLYGILTVPLNDALRERQAHLVFTSLTEPFLLYIKVGMLGGLFLAMPVIFLQLWLFVRPAFRGNEERFAGAFVFFGSLLFVTGAGFGYFVVFPVGFQFLIAYGGDDFVPMLTVGDYFGLVTRLLLAFGAMFEMPLVFVLLGRMGVVQAPTLRRLRRHAVVVLLIVAAIVTPTPDVFSQVMLAGPLYVLYELSIVLVAMSDRKKTPSGPAAAP